MVAVFDALGYMFMQQHRDEVSPFRMHALLYLAHGDCLAAQERPLVDSGFEAWLVAPINRELYESQRGGGRWEHDAEPDHLDTAQKGALVQVLDRYARTPDGDLRRIVRDPVWANTRDRAGAGPDDGCTAHMPDTEIAVYFRAAGQAVTAF
ncbi:Panacea domain-containing protein [Yinghuangia soli]|uniref:Antitoxin SocA-like Panacea domain-containing protein n=1 Tax=Yinghuangia soli TaxID=2908204 RepID=A0AA41TY14_9ACTN|nr:hypothetical protein [Yinghuangia soli]MCF2525901.1 hypothetical protein [Yinghuangia soli]